MLVDGAVQGVVASFRSAVHSSAVAAPVVAHLTLKNMDVMLEKQNITSYATGA